MARLSKYELQGLLGSGAYADVYLAQDTDLNRTVAVKVLKPALMADLEAFNRFRKEAQTASGLFHPHIATVFDMGEVNGRRFIAMRYIDGKPLDQHIKMKGPLDWRTALKYIDQICSALQFAHARGLVHRDVKPQNIMISAEDGAVLTDFGLVSAYSAEVKTTASGIVMGTPAYVPPEVWDGNPAVAASDQYALACVIVEMLTGKTLFDGPTPSAVMRKHFSARTLPENWPPGAPAGLSAVLRKALQADPNQRYPTCSALLQALQPAAAGLNSAEIENLKAEKRAAQEQARIEAERRTTSEKTAAQELARLQAEKRAAEERAQREANKRADLEKQATARQRRESVAIELSPWNPRDLFNMLWLFMLDFDQFKKLAGGNFTDYSFKEPTPGLASRESLLRVSSMLGYSLMALPLLLSWIMIALRLLKLNQNFPITFAGLPILLALGWLLASTRALGFGSDSYGLIIFGVGILSGLFLLFQNTFVTEGGWSFFALGACFVGMLTAENLSSYFKHKGYRSYGAYQDLWMPQALFTLLVILGFIEILLIGWALFSVLGLY